MGRFSHIIEKTFYVIGGLFAFFLVLGIVLHFLEPERDYEKDPKRVSESAYAKYTKESHSDLYEKYQDEGIARIKDLERLAVNKLATTNNACNEIVSVGFAGKETFINDFTVLVECANKERFHVSETDIKNNRALLPLSKGHQVNAEKTSSASKTNQRDAKKEVSTIDKKDYPRTVFADKATDIKDIRFIMAAKKTLTNTLVDPKSAEFKNVFLHVNSDGQLMTCGMVNSKNRFGGYGGYEYFISTLSMAVLESQMTSGSEFKKAWDLYCVN